MEGILLKLIFEIFCLDSPSFSSTKNYYLSLHILWEFEFLGFGYFMTYPALVQLKGDKHFHSQFEKWCQREGAISWVITYPEWSHNFKYKFKHLSCNPISVIYC